VPTGKITNIGGVSAHYGVVLHVKNISTVLKFYKKHCIKNQELFAIKFYLILDFQLF
jgi:hypothetical protein